MKNKVLLIAAMVLVFGLATTDVASAIVGYDGDSETTTESNGGGRSGSNRRGSSSNSSSSNGEVLGESTFVFNNNLSEGMTSDEVRELQEQLRAEGFFTFPTSTGYFGPITRAAVVAYQTAKGIPATGFVGPLTRAALNA